jgi:hypothetical protein
MATDGEFEEVVCCECRCTFTPHESENFYCEECDMPCCQKCTEIDANNRYLCLECFKEIGVD